MMSRNFRSLHEVDVEHFRNHPEEIPQYLDIAFEEAEMDGDWDSFRSSLLIASEALGEVAGATIGDGDDPRIGSLNTILRGLGLRLSIKPAEHSPTGK